MAVLRAQAPGDPLNMFFDDASDDLQLDSVYPAGCWQIGPPNKPVFTSAYSEPNALVTDTILPHTDSLICYAEYTLIATEFNYLGRYIEFKQQRDMDPNTTAGWVELMTYGIWNKVGGEYDWYDQGAPTYTDSGLVFTGSSNGWEDVSVYSPCAYVMTQHADDRTYEEVLHVRFAFSSNANPNGNDGWIIDNVRASVELCYGGVEEETLSAFTVFPNPANNHLTLETMEQPATGTMVEMRRSDGALVIRQPWRGSRTMTLRTDGLPNGLYFVAVLGEGRASSSRIIVQH